MDGDIKEASKIFGGASFDVVTCNPPYMEGNHGLKNPEDAKAIARHEVLCNLEDVIREAARAEINWVHCSSFSTTVNEKLGVATIQLHK